MVYRRMSRGLSIRPVNRIKHVVDAQNAALAGNQTNDDLVDTQDNPVQSTPNQVETGSKINGIYLKLEVRATNAAALPNCYMYVFKNPGNALTAPAPNQVGISNVKKYVIHQEMVMLQSEGTGDPEANARILFNGVIAIPKLYRRNGPDDRLKLVLLAPGVDIEYCFQCHYKEFR